MTLAEAFHQQAVHCGALGSPFMVRLMGLLANRLERGSRVADRVLDWPGDPSPGADSVPLRLAGALHALKLEGKALSEVYPPNEVGDDALWSALDAAMREHEAQILDWMQSAPQTNEVRRAAVLLPGLAMVQARFDLPVALVELGCSGGLNLRCDQFCLDAGGAVLGPVDGRVHLTPDWRGNPPPAALPWVIDRKGVDLNPLEPTDEDDRLRLLAYLWPDQSERMERTLGAIEIAAQHPAKITEGDAGDFLADALTNRPKGAVTVIFHTIAWQYFPPATVEVANAAIASAGAMATKDWPLAHLSMEADGGEGAAVMLTTWPGGMPEMIARVDFHGRWVDWRAG